jgi:hypothetical protein
LPKLHPLALLDAFTSVGTLFLTAVFFDFYLYAAVRFNNLRISNLSFVCQQVASTFLQPSVESCFLGENFFQLIIEDAFMFGSYRNGCATNTKKLDIVQISRRQCDTNCIDALAITTDTK